MAQNPVRLINKYPKDLKSQIRELIEKGYTVTVQTGDSAQLVRKKKFSAGLAILGLLFWGVGFLLYLIYYLAQRDETIYLDLETQNPDPNWKANERKRLIKKAKWITGGVIAFFLFMGAISQLAGTTSTTPVAEVATVRYEEVWQNDSKTIISVVIKPEDANTATLQKLGRELKIQYKDASRMRVSIFTDKKAAGYLEKFINSTDGSLTKAQTDLYDTSFIAQYNKNGGTGLEQIDIHTDGINGKTTSTDLSK